MVEYYVAAQESNSSDWLENVDAEGYQVIEETLSAYGSGGFHPVQIGDIFNGRYQVIRKLGFGTTSTSFRLRVLKFRQNRAVALKVTTTRAGTVELDNLLRYKAISPEHPGQSHLPELLDHFQHTGINGTHTCLVFELLGQNIGLFCRRLFSRNQLPPKLDKMVV